MDQTLERPKMSPKDFFVYLGTAVTLYASAGSLLALLFAIVNSKFPDPLAYGYGYYGETSSPITFAISTLLVVFPLFLTLSWYARKEIGRDPSKANLAIRKWFVWFTLFITGATIAGDVIALVHTYLGGEVTARFIWKMISVLIVAGVIFAYYLYDMRRAKAGDTSVNKPLIWIAGLGVLAAIVLGFVVVGSPATQRAVRFDNMRAQHLGDIQWQILNHWQTNEKLPTTLGDLTDNFSGYIVPTDPETKAEYEYHILGPLMFELCATFTQSNEGMVDEDSMARYMVEGLDPRFEHAAGRTCFERTVDPVKYPPYTKI